VAGRIFISYRRADTAGPAGWLYDRLAGHFGRPQVVKDVDSIQLGDDFAEVIAAAVASCDALIVLIGHQWLTAAGPDGQRSLYNPNDFVRLEIESALTRDLPVIPVLVDGARMPLDGELPPSLAGLLYRQPLALGPSQPDADVARLLQVLDQNITQTQATQASPVFGQPTGPRQAQYGPTPGPQALPKTRTLRPRRRPRTRTIALVACGAVIAAVVAFIAIPGGAPTSSPSAASHHNSSPKAAPSPTPAASSKIILTDDFSTQKINWVDDAHQAAGAYTGTGAYRLSVTGANGVSELARPSSATHGLSGVTPLNLSVTVDVRKLAGAAQGYGYGIAFRGDGGGNLYAFVLEDHAVAIQKWVGGGAQVADSPAPVSTSAVHADAADRLRAVCVTADGGQAVHLELWLNGKKLVDYTDRDHPYTKGYLGLYVESISDASSTAGAEFDNFTAAQL
jgi:TIR domain